MSLFSGFGFFGEYDTWTAPEPELGQAPRQGSAVGERQRTLRRGIWQEWRGCRLTALSICSARDLVSCAWRFPYPSTYIKHHMRDKSRGFEILSQEEALLGGSAELYQLVSLRELEASSHLNVRLSCHRLQVPDEVSGTDAVHFGQHRLL